jgi:hypothetical protein
MLHHFTTIYTTNKFLYKFPYDYNNFLYNFSFYTASKFWVTQRDTVVASRGRRIDKAAAAS